MKKRREGTVKKPQKGCLREFFKKEKRKEELLYIFTISASASSSGVLYSWVLTMIFC